MAAARWYQWRDDTDAQKLRNCADGLDADEQRQNRHDRYHVEREAAEKEWREHVDEELGGLKKILMAFIATSSGLIVAASINIAILISSK